jgi:hypothetical protein
VEKNDDPQLLRKLLQDYYLLLGCVKYYAIDCNEEAGCINDGGHKAKETLSRLNIKIGELDGKDKN